MESLRKQRLFIPPYQESSSKGGYVYLLQEEFKSIVSPKK